jgi:hypothetical protein
MMQNGLYKISYFLKNKTKFFLGPQFSWIVKIFTFITLQVADGINKFVCVPTQMGAKNKRRMENANRPELRHPQIGHSHRNNNKTKSNNQRSRNRDNRQLRTGNGHIPNGPNAPSHAALVVRPQISFLINFDFPVNRGSFTEKMQMIIP